MNLIVSESSDAQRECLGDLKTRDAKINVRVASMLAPDVGKEARTQQRDRLVDDLMLKQDEMGAEYYLKSMIHTMESQIT